MRFLLVDAQNLFYRAIHIVQGNNETKAGLALHIMLSSIAQSWRIFNADHVVLALECRSADNWRRAIDERYKVNRQEIREAMKPKEKETMEYMYSVYNDCIDFLTNHTNISVVRCPIAEADDMIAHWANTHPDDDHVIISSDRDFQQLVADNVVIFNGIDRKILTTVDSKLGSIILLEDRMPKDFKMVTVEDPEYLLFEKIVRGDAGDNVFSAFPGVRKNSAKDKPGILKAYEDRHEQGYEWNNFMMSKWTDHHKVEHLVKDCFLRNKMLVDLKAQPDEVKKSMDEVLQTIAESNKQNNVGFHFFRFCNKYGLEQLSDRGEEIIRILSSPYVKD